MYICIGKNTTRIILTVALMVCISRSAVSVYFSRRQPVAAYEWGLHFEKPSAAPVPNLSDDKLNPYSAYYHANPDMKKIYITFDAGYENGHTAAILDSLKKHNASAVFFLVGPYIEENPELVKRMVAEGHTVGNHSYSHPDMTGKSKERFMNELNKTRQAYKNVTGQEMPLYYRPPEGKFTTENLQWAQEMGYTTLLWSSAYVDWNNESQPDHRYAFDKIKERTFPGAVFLLHSTSATNARILDQQLTLWEQDGYSFGKISDLVKEYKPMENRHE